MLIQEPMVSDGSERGPPMIEGELRDACLHCAATIVVAFVLGCEFEDCQLDDDGYPWPTSASRVYLKYPPGISLANVASIYEAGAMAVAKRHGRAPHLIIDMRTSALPGDNETRRLLDDPKIWETVEAMARLIEENEFEGCYGALGTDYRDPPSRPGRVVRLSDYQDSAAIKLLKNAELKSLRPA